MAKGIQTANGKAFEFACLWNIYFELSGEQDVIIEDSVQLETAKKLYSELKAEDRIAMDDAARAAVRVIKRLEPQLWMPEDNQPLILSLQPDSAGIRGDVRDVLCIRKKNEWQVGFSCKHNHRAVKHSRLSATIDFGKEWLNIPCSKQYFAEVVPLFDRLREIRDVSKAEGKPVLWDEIEGKAENYYIPILQSFMKELKRIDAENEGVVPEALIRYLLGRFDFYKIITDDKNRTTRVEAINIAGTLNKSAGSEKAITKVPLLKMPMQFYHIDFKKGSDNTIEVVCDEGWQLSMRIHSASSKVEPSLKFDVNLVSLPSSVHSQVEPWDVDESKKRKERLNAYTTRIM